MDARAEDEKSAFMMRVYCEANPCHHPQGPDDRTEFAVDLSQASHRKSSRMKSAEVIVAGAVRGVRAGQSRAWKLPAHTRRPPMANVTE